MTVWVTGMPKNIGFDLFVIQTAEQAVRPVLVPERSQVGANGVGAATVKGIFDSETFTVSPGGTTTVPRRHDPAAAPVPPGPVVQQPEDPVQARLRGLAQPLRSLLLSTASSTPGFRP